MAWICGAEAPVNQRHPSLGSAVMPPQPSPSTTSYGKRSRGSVVVSGSCCPRCWKQRGRGRVERGWGKWCQDWPVRPCRSLAEVVPLGPCEWGTTPRSPTKPIACSARAPVDPLLVRPKCSHVRQLAYGACYRKLEWFGFRFVLRARNGAGAAVRPKSRRRMSISVFCGSGWLRIRSRCLRFGTHAASTHDGHSQGTVCSA